MTASTARANFAQWARNILAMVGMFCPGAPIQGISQQYTLTLAGHYTCTHMSGLHVQYCFFQPYQLVTQRGVALYKSVIGWLNSMGQYDLMALRCCWFCDVWCHSLVNMFSKALIVTRFLTNTLITQNI